MKRLLSGSVVLILLCGAIALSGGQTAKLDQGGVTVQVAERNPWTNLKLNNGPETFHFAVIADRTGGHRPRVFSQAVDQINLMQPAFVVSVGDLIEGYSKVPSKVAAEWKEFQSYVHKLQMPFFYVPGNHDIANPGQSKEWSERFGRAYYHFLYKDVLFLCLNSDDPNEEVARGKFSPEQVAYVAKTLQDNPGVRWTFVFLHKPVWTHPDLDSSGWLDIEKSLSSRPYTVFAGHLHRYQKYVRNGRNYYQLATTGGGSKMRGLPYAEFDQIAWISMKKESPVIANLMLQGILPENLKTNISDEEGYTYYNRKPPVPVEVKVRLDGAPLPGAWIEFHALDASGKKSIRVADGYSEGDGSFVPSSYKPQDGVPAGEYVVTAILREPWLDAKGIPGPNKLPDAFSRFTTSPLRATIKAAEPNEVVLNLTR